MKKNSVVLMILMVAGLFLTSCEKEFLPIPTGTHDNRSPQTREGEGGDDGDIGDPDDDSEEGITDGGRDEDFDKTGKKKPKGS